MSFSILYYERKVTKQNLRIHVPLIGLLFQYHNFRQLKGYIYVYIYQFLLCVMPNCISKYLSVNTLIEVDIS